MKRISSFVAGAAVGALASIVTSARARAADPPAALAAFGRPGSAIVEVAGASARSQEVQGLAETTRTVAAALAVSTVITSGWSLGAGLVLGYGRTTAPSGRITTTELGAELRMGRLTVLAPLVSWWPQVGVGYSRASVSSTDPSITLVGTARGLAMVDLDAPVLLHPGARFFVAAGPGVEARFSSDTQAFAVLGRVSFGWCL